MEKILVGTDTSARAERAVEAAAGLATAHDAELIVLHVKPPFDAREVFDPEKMPDANGYLDRMRGGGRDRGEEPWDPWSQPVVPGQRPPGRGHPRAVLGVHRGREGGAMAAVRTMSRVRGGE